MRKWPTREVHTLWPSDRHCLVTVLQGWGMGFLQFLAQPAMGTFSLVPRPFLRTCEEFEIMGRRKARERARVRAQKGYGNETRPLSVCNWLIFPLRPLAVSWRVVSRGGTMVWRVLTVTCGR